MGAKKGRIPWNKGKKGVQTSWNKGLTKETDARVMSTATKLTGRDGGCRTQETRDRMSKSAPKEHPWSRGIPRSQVTRDRISSSNKGKGHLHTDEFKKSVGLASKERWNNPEYAKRVSAKVLEVNKTIRPNNPENKLLDILKELHKSSLAYVGDGSFWVGGKNPDFIDVNKKQIIEVLGCYWHGCPKHFPHKQKKNFISRIELFKRLGYSTLCIWECELNDSMKVIQKILEFINRECS